MKLKGKNDNKLYTARGDDGTTTLFNCHQMRLSKSSNIIEALGSVDELNAYIGIIKVNSGIKEFVVKLGKKNITYQEILGDIQQSLFIIQAEVGGSESHIGKKELNKIENMIEIISGDLPPIRSFTVSGGSTASAMLDFGRTLARRSERRIISVVDEGVKKLNPHTLSYMNRLSTILFVLSRYANHILSIKEEHPKYNKTKI